MVKIVTQSPLSNDSYSILTSQFTLSFTCFSEQCFSFTVFEVGWIKAVSVMSYTEHGIYKYVP